MQGHDPTGVVDIPRALAAGGNRPTQGILQGAAFKRGIDAGLGHSAPEIGSKPWGLGSPRHACHSYEISMRSMAGKAFHDFSGGTSTRRLPRRGTLGAEGGWGYGTRDS